MGASKLAQKRTSDDHGRSGMTPAQYVDQIVIPTVREFRDNRRSRRHAYLACLVTFHIKDHLAKAGETRIETKMRTGRSPKAFDLVRAICNGTKHVETNGSHPHPIQFQAGTDYDRPPARASEMIVGLSVL